MKSTATPTSTGSRGFLFINNVHFAARKAQLRLGPEIGLEASAGTSLEIVSHFPEKKRIEKEDGSGFQAGDTLEIWVRPFEVLMLEVGPAGNCLKGPPETGSIRRTGFPAGEGIDPRVTALGGLDGHRIRRCRSV